MSPGTIGALTLLHEIAHGLGLKHTFEHPVVNRSLESNTYTLMSYTAPNEGWYGSGSWAISHTPMILDVPALQFLYGAQTHNEIDTVYFWTDPDIPFAATIWDSDGVDTLDFSNFTLGHDISLVDGTSSTINFPVSGTGWDVGQLPDNLSIAPGALIENVIGGDGNDTILGNSLANLIDGGFGNDTMDGGAGADTFEFYDDFGDDRILNFDTSSDKLKFLDEDENLIASGSIASESVDGNLVLTLGDSSLTLTGLAGTSFDDSFLVIA
jgi:Ca2+-binding RTX toxin-like protein